MEWWTSVGVYMDCKVMPFNPAQWPFRVIRAHAPTVLISSLLYQLGWSDLSCFLWLICLPSWMWRPGSRSSLWYYIPGPRSLPTTMKITATKCLSLLAQGQLILKWNLMRGVRLRKGETHRFLSQATVGQKEAKEVMGLCLHRYDYLEFTDSRGGKTRYDTKVGTYKWPKVSGIPRRKWSTPFGSFFSFC